MGGTLRRGSDSAYLEYCRAVDDPFDWWHARCTLFGETLDLASVRDIAFQYGDVSSEISQFMD